MDGNGFYISYNDHDIDTYGCKTTAFVIGQMEGFLILNGDHREAYSVLIPLGFDACLAYFMANVAKPTSAVSSRGCRASWLGCQSNTAS